MCGQFTIVTTAAALSRIHNGLKNLLCNKQFVGFRKAIQMHAAIQQASLEAPLICKSHSF